MTPSLLTRSLLLVAASTLSASAAWAFDAPSPDGSGNNVGAVLSKSVPSPAPSSANTTETATYHAAAPAAAFNPAAYGSATDCLNAAELAHQQLAQCERGRTR